MPASATGIWSIISGAGAFSRPRMHYAGDLRKRHRSSGRPQQFAHVATHNLRIRAGREERRRRCRVAAADDGSAAAAGRCTLNRFVVDHYGGGTNAKRFVVRLRMLVRTSLTGAALTENAMLSIRTTQALRTHDRSSIACVVNSEQLFGGEPVFSASGSFDTDRIRADETSC